MTNKPKLSKDKSTTSYRIIGYVFLFAAIIMFLLESTRGVAIAFFVIGIAFIVMHQSLDDNPAKK